jgi:hypothetical protein
MSYHCSLVFQIRISVYRPLDNVNLTMFCDACVGVLQHRHHILRVTKFGDQNYPHGRDLGTDYRVSTCSGWFTSGSTRRG